MNFLEVEIKKFMNEITKLLGFLWVLSAINGFGTLFFLDLLPKLQDKPSRMQRWTKWTVFTAITFVVLLFATMLAAVMKG